MDDIVDINTLFGPQPSASADLPVEALLTLMEKHQVAAACTLSTLGLLLDPSIGNSATRGACGEQPKLVPVATLNPTQFLGDPEPVRRLRDDGFAMLRFFPAMQGWPVDFHPFAALLKVVSEIALPIMIDIELHGEISRLAPILRSYPGPVIVAGVGIGTLAEALCLLREHSNLHLEISKLLASGCLQAVAQAVGTDRVLFGSGAPAQPVAGPLYTLRYAGLPEPSIQQILGANARRILQLRSQ